MMRFFDYLKAWPQYLMPGHLISRAVHSLTRVQTPAVKNRLIDTFNALYHVDLAEAVEPDPHAYPSFNAFFTRALRPGARPQPDDPTAIASPVDGVVSQTGDLHGTT
ncbi:MAG TPA: phosphatidylserine decarboxylase, partial [Gammaproteobacteria bacterium]|nr:phosphatidylserine decarboxylase [Gammaproteobacteria bacterium]